MPECCPENNAPQGPKYIFTVSLLTMLVNKLLTYHLSWNIFAILTRSLPVLVATLQCHSSLKYRPPPPHTLNQTLRIVKKNEIIFQMMVKK